MENKYMEKDEIKKMSYTDFIAFIKETNRCPGGKDTIRKIFNILNTSSNTKILEIGSNTGFTSLETLHITESKIEGIDVSENCVIESNLRKSYESKEMQERINFQKGSAYDIPFRDSQFDILLAGGATAFMDQKEKALSEYFRVLKNWGFVCITPLVYKTDPPLELLDEVSKAIGIKIEKMSTDDWINLFFINNENYELYYKETNSVKSVDELELNNYINFFLEKPHIRDLSAEIKEMILEKWRGYISVFNENHKYLNYSILIFRKTLYPEEPELFKIDK